LATLTEVTVHHQALDYIGVFGGLVGGLAAIVALWFAVLSKRDAKRSADAAERSTKASERSADAAEAALVISREEAEVIRAERERQADLRIDMEARAIGTAPEWPPAVVMLTLKVENTGTRDAERVIAKVAVPDTLQMEAVEDHEGNITTPGQVHWEDARLGGHRGVCFWSDLVLLTQGGAIGQHLRIEKPPAGIYRVSAGLSSGDLPAGHLWRFWQLQVGIGDDSIALRAEGQPS
jgi:hypothetical protein